MRLKKSVSRQQRSMWAAAAGGGEVGNRDFLEKMSGEGNQGYNLRDLQHLKDQ